VSHYLILRNLEDVTLKTGVTVTEEQIVSTLDKIRPNIQKLAFCFVVKMKQPSIHSIDDLVQEGEKAAITHIRAGRIDESKGTATTYLIGGVVRHFIELMKKSYKSDPIMSKDDEISQSLLSRGVVESLENCVDTFLHLSNILDGREKQYALMFLSPDNSTQKKIQSNRKRTRVVIREELQMTKDEEREIRRRIWKKLTT
jgi:hypothetical protein